MLDKYHFYHPGLGKLKCSHDDVSRLMCVLNFTQQWVSGPPKWLGFILRLTWMSNVMVVNTIVFQTFHSETKMSTCWSGLCETQSVGFIVWAPWIFFTWPHDLNRSTSVGDILVQRCGQTDRSPWIIRKAMAQIITKLLWYYCVHFKWLEDIVVSLCLLYELQKHEMQSPTENKIN